MDREQSFYRPKPGSSDLFQNSENPLHIPQQLTEEDRKEWRECIRTSLLKVGIPFAAATEFANFYFERKAKVSTPATPINFVVRSFYFTLRTILGSFLYSPLCYSKLRAKYLPSQVNPGESEEEFLALKNRESIQKDVSFDKSWDSNLTESESTFSHLNMDINSSVSDDIVLEDTQEQQEQQVKPIPRTTYDKLRRAHRSNYIKLTEERLKGSQKSYSQSEVDGSESPPKLDYDAFRPKPDDGAPPPKLDYDAFRPKPNVDDSPPPNANAPPVKRKLKNKYGDDIDL